jgi:hypothetical protein
MLEDIYNIGLAAALVLLVGYLHHKHWQRVRSRISPRISAGWTGKPIDAEKLKPAVESVRGDYLAACRPTAGFCFHKSLLGFARRAVASLGYFRGKAPEEHAQTATKGAK